MYIRIVYIIWSFEYFPNILYCHLFHCGGIEIDYYKFWDKNYKIQ